MTRKIWPFLFFVLLISVALAAPLRAEDFITLNLPETVIAQAAATVPPLRIDAHSKTIEGDITIINISELQLTENHIACRLHLTGKNLAFLAEIAGHEIRLKVGAVELDFKTNAAIRFDAQKQILYVKPLVKDVATSGGGSNADISQALVAVLNDKEFPITIQELNPLIARTGSKTVTIATTIANIEAKPHAIQLSLRPTVTAK